MVRGLVNLLALGLGLGLGACATTTPDAPTPVLDSRPKSKRPQPSAGAQSACGAGLRAHAQARALLACFELDAAFATYERLLLADRRDSRAGLDLAQLGLEFGRREAAEGALSRALERDRVQSLGARLGLALLYLDRYERVGAAEDFDACENHLQNTLAVDAGNPHAHALAVLLYLHRAERAGNDGAAPLARAICQEREPSHAALAASCAEEAWRRGEPARARLLFERATQADAEHHGAWLRHGILELEAGNYRRGRALLERAVASPWPSVRVAAGVSVGATLEHLGDTPGAVARYRDALALCERSDQAPPLALLFNLGLALSRSAESSEELDEAEATLRRYVERTSAGGSLALQAEAALRELELIRAEYQRAQ